MLIKWNGGTICCVQGTLLLQGWSVDGNDQCDDEVRIGINAWWRWENPRGDRVGTGQVLSAEWV